MKNDFFAETALLGQGLADCSNEKILEAWQKALPLNLEALVWLWQGEITVGTLPQFLQVRHAPDMGRFNMYNLPSAMADGKSGFLTAGGAMRAAADLGKKAVVSCGIGGITAAEVSSDFPALCSLPVWLLATAVKDMFDPAFVLEYLHKHKIRVFGFEQSAADGYMFIGNAVPLDGCLRCGGDLPQDVRLLLNPIPQAKRITDRRILAKALAAGEKAKAAGGIYHPAVNRALAEMTDGKTSEIQLLAFLKNIEIACRWKF